MEPSQTERANEVASATKLFILAGITNIAIITNSFINEAMGAKDLDRMLQPFLFLTTAEMIAGIIHMRRQIHADILMIVRGTRGT